MLSGLLQCGMGRSFQKNHHPDANLALHQKAKAEPMRLVVCIALSSGECIVGKIIRGESNER